MYTSNERRRPDPRVPDHVLQASDAMTRDCQVWKVLLLLVSMSLAWWLTLHALCANSVGLMPRKAVPRFAHYCKPALIPSSCDCVIGLSAKQSVWMSKATFRPTWKIYDAEEHQDCERYLARPVSGWISSMDCTWLACHSTMGQRVMPFLVTESSLLPLHINIACAWSFIE